ncbi:MAG: polysaccharide biosynthesis tyrosine autokinase [Cyanobacteria bacterium]|nr:polysaccharide biosynthesis tyrosine autokinase [Cyanobacteria bacterium GSL.Bin1]
MASSDQSYPLANAPSSTASSLSATTSPPEILNPTDEDSFNYRQIVAIIRRRVWLILIVSVTVTGAIWTKTLTQPPRYRSSFQLLVEPIAGDETYQQLSEQLGESNESIRASLSSQSSGLDYPTQIQVLKSSQTMQPIYRQLKEDYPTLTYEGLIRNLTIQRLGETKIIEVSYESGDPEMASAVTGFIAEEYIGYSQEQQRSGEQRVLQLIEEQLPELQEKVDSIQIEIQQFRNQNNIIDPVERGTLLSEKMSNLEERQQDTEVAISENISLRESLLQQLGLGLDEAMTTVALSEAPRYQELLNQLKEIETQIAIELGRFREDSPQIQTLQQQKQRLLELLRQEALAILGQEEVSEKINSQVSAPNPVRLSLTQDLITATNQLRVLRVREAALEEAEVEVRNNLNNLANLAKEYESMVQRLEIAKTNMERLISRREQLQIQAVGKTLPWSTLEPPNLPTEPIAGKGRGLILGAIAGLLAGAGAAYLAEKIDNKFHSVEEVKEKTGLPILAVIPFVKALQKQEGEQDNGLSSVDDNSETEAETKPRLNSVEGKEQKPLITGTVFFAFTEAFKTLHTNLSFLKPDHPVKSLIVSSCVPGEGKSTVALNLARAAAAVGKRVLLVDADMRRPRLHQTFEIPNQYGLSNVISAGLSLEETMQESPIDDNLYLLTSGPTPPDTNCLLASERMQELAQNWENSFDLVIYDTPPLGGIADAKLLAPLTSGLIMVVGLGVIDRSLFRDVMDTLRLSRTNVLGLVPNACQQRSMGEYYYYYSYYHNYYAGSASSQRSLAATNRNGNSSSEKQETT